MKNFRRKICFNYFESRLKRKPTKHWSESYTGPIFCNLKNIWLPYCPCLGGWFPPGGFKIWSLIGLVRNIRVRMSRSTRPSSIILRFMSESFRGGLASSIRVFEKLIRKSEIWPFPILTTSRSKLRRVRIITRNWFWPSTVLLIKRCHISKKCSNRNLVFEDHPLTGEIVRNSYIAYFVQ